MSGTLRTPLALALLYSALLFLVGDFNEYVTFGGRVFVDRRPHLAARLAYSVSLGSLPALVSWGALLGLERLSLACWHARLLCLLATFAAVLYFFGDLNLYVVGNGPGGRDWVKGSLWGVARLGVCAALSVPLSLLSLAVLWALTGAGRSTDGGTG